MQVIQVGTALHRVCETPRSNVKGELSDLFEPSLVRNPNGATSVGADPLNTLWFEGGITTFVSGWPHVVSGRRLHAGGAGCCKGFAPGPIRSPNRVMVSMMSLTHLHGFVV